jgi:protein phosphatase 1L
MYCFDEGNNAITAHIQVMSNQEAADAIKDIKDPQAAAKHLTEQAVIRKSKDDISCIVVKFMC